MDFAFRGPLSNIHTILPDYIHVSMAIPSRVDLAVAPKFSPLSTEEWSRCAFQEQIRNTKNSTLFIVHI